MADSFVSLSKFCSLVLRHQPEKIGLSLDPNGWADVDELIRLARQHGAALTKPLLEQVVAQNSKNRFEFNEDHSLIRARQGHSVQVDLELPVVQPPEWLYHGTAHDSSIRSMPVGSFPVLVNMSISRLTYLLLSRSANVMANQPYLRFRRSRCPKQATTFIFHRMVSG